jgi:hypothetical protein
MLREATNYNISSAAALARSVLTSGSKSLAQGKLVRYIEIGIDIDILIWEYQYRYIKTQNPIFRNISL